MKAKQQIADFPISFNTYKEEQAAIAELCTLLKKPLEFTRNHEKPQPSIRLIEGKYVDMQQNMVLTDTIPVEQRKFYGSRLPKDISCYNAVTGKYQNVELFSPVLYDQEQLPPKYNPNWEVYDGTGKTKKLLYIDYPPDYVRYWAVQRERCINGYTIGGVHITGRFYFYLNFWRIRTKTKGKSYSPPRFLDLDKEFFDLVEEAVKADVNLLLLKRRQIGFSEKSAAIVAHEFTFFSTSFSLIAAGEKAYAEGTMQKVTMGLNQLSPQNSNGAREFYKRRDIKDVSKEFITASFVSDNVEVGYLSSVEAVTVNANPSAVVGRVCTIAVLEEAGVNGVLIPTYALLLPAMMEQDRLDGRLVLIIGTGGVKGAGVYQFKEMYYSPQEYRLLAVKNTYERVPSDDLVCPFFPAWKFYIMDHDGNSYKAQGIKLIEEARSKIAHKAEQLAIAKMNMPLTPSEAFTSSTESLFNTAKLQARLDELYTLNRRNPLATKGRFETLGKNKGVKFVPAPLDQQWAKDADGDDLYPVEIYEFPETDGQDFLTRTPEQVLNFNPSGETARKYGNLYFGGLDSYDKDQAASSDSLGSCSIFKGYFSSSKTSNTFVARLTWRPKTKEKFFEQSMLMCYYYYGAKNLIEWSNITIFDWAIHNGYAWLLQERPRSTYANIKETVASNKYGVDPNTKNVWIEHMKSYIEDYAHSLLDMKSVERFLQFRAQKENGRKYNCDITIGNLLAYENARDRMQRLERVNSTTSATDYIRRSSQYVKR